MIKGRKEHITLRRVCYLCKYAQCMRNGEVPTTKIQLSPISMNVNVEVQIHTGLAF